MANERIQVAGQKLFNFLQDGRCAVAAGCHFPSRLGDSVIIVVARISPDIFRSWMAHEFGGMARTIRCWECLDEICIG